MVSMRPEVVEALADGIRRGASVWEFAAIEFEMTPTAEEREAAWAVVRAEGGEDQ